MILSDFLSLILLACFTVYGVFLLLFLIGLGRLTSPKENVTIPPFISVVIAARNEEDNIATTLKSLTRQDYPRDRMEWIVVDDRSTDQTAAIVEGFQPTMPWLKLLRVTQCPPQVSPKKHALEHGIQNAKGEIIVATDANCQFDPGWLSHLLAYFQSDVGAVTGLTEFYWEGNRVPLWQKIQALDFLSYSFCGAGAVGLGMAFNANGHNLAYRRKVFEEVDGYQGLHRNVSGDDILLIQKIDRQTGWKIVYAVDPETVVKTKPVSNLKELFQQRFRWGSNGPYYRPLVRFFLTFTFLFYCMLFLSPLFILLGWLNWKIFIIGLLGKIIFDYLVVSTGLKRFQISGMKKYFWPTQLVQTPMILLFGIGGFFFKFTWKGQRLAATRDVPTK
ncbi:glycosyltransferase [candidate division KSB1 bacterium]|nr:glycosyltransferase [candidate division KSB1 bacterium]